MSEQNVVEQIENEAEAQGRIRVSFTDFCLTFNRASSYEEVELLTGLTLASVKARAAKYRKMGYALKKFARKSEGSRLPDPATFNREVLKVST